MAHHMEPMDIDMTEDKENSFVQNVQTTEKGYEELDASEVNMRLRYSMTPISSPMSKSYSVQCPDKTDNDENKPDNGNPILTRSLNATVTRDTPKTLPLQVLNDSTDDPNRTAAVLRSIDSVISEGADITVTVSNDSDNSFPSSSSSAACTPEATTPTKEIPKPQGSPIMRGLKSVLNIFRTSQSPIPPDENELPDDSILNPNEPSSTQNPQSIIASTPLVTNKKEKEVQQKNSIAFKNNLEKELLWNDDETIIFTKKEKVPIHKLLFSLPQSIPDTIPTDVSMAEEKANATLEAMDISYNDSIVKAPVIEKVVDTENNTSVAISEQDESVFLDCESTLNETLLLEGTMPVNTSANVTSNLNKSVEANETLNETNLSMKSAVTLPDLFNPATEASQDTINNTIESVKFNIESTETNDITHPPTENMNTVFNPNVTQDVGSNEQEFVNEQVTCEANVTAEIILNKTVDIIDQTPIVSFIEKAGEIANATVILEEKPSSDKVNEDILNVTDKSQTIIQSENALEDNIIVTNTNINVTNENRSSLTPSFNQTVDLSTHHVEIESNVIFDEENIPAEAQLNSASNVAENELSAAKDNVDNKVEEMKQNTNIEEATVHIEDLKNMILSEIDDSLKKETIQKIDNTTQIEIKIPDKDIKVNINKEESTVHIEDSENKIVSEIDDSLKKETIQKIDNTTETENKIADEEIKVNINKVESTVHIEDSENKMVSEIDDSLKEETIQKIDTTTGTENKIAPEISMNSEQNAEPKIGPQEIKSKIDESIDPAMILSSIQITDDAVVISTPNNKAMQVLTTNEDISMVDADFLVPKDENDSDEINPHDLDDNWLATEKNNSRTIETITNIDQKIKIDNPEEEIVQVVLPESQAQPTSETNDEEIFVSESNSPYVSLKPDDDNEILPDSTTFEEPTEENKFVSRETINSSPPIVSKGYSFNFDEIDDPFATNTKVRLSPSLDGNKTINFDTTFEPIVKIPAKSTKSPIKKPKVVEKVESLNATKNDEDHEATHISNNKTISIERIKTSSIVFDEAIVEAQESVSSETTESSVVSNDAESNIHTDSLEQPVNIHPKDTSSSEQSTYFSLGSSTGEVVETKVTMPIFDEDSIMNPFATSSKMRLSPPPSETVVEAINNALCQENVQENDMDIDTHNVINDMTQNISHTSDSSKATDEKNDTVREVNTEDEDTMEGPFIEAALTNYTDDLADFVSERVDIDEFKSLPAQAGVENPESGEIFIDAEAFEFLMNQNKSNEVVDSGKESLFLKFDPLFAKRINSDGVLDVLAKIQKRQSTPKKMGPQMLRRSQQSDNTAGPSNAAVGVVPTNVTEETEDQSMKIPQKPTMVVPPAVNPATEPKLRATTPPRPQRRSMTFTSPAMAVIDRLLSLSANNTPSGIDNTILINAEREEADRALAELRDLLAEKELNVHHLKSESNELRNRLTTLESHMTNLEEEGQKRLRNINELTEKLTNKNKLNKSMEAVVEEYERTIAGLIAETEADKKRHAEERMQIINDRDEQTAHLASMEVAFSDLHSKYEKSKQIIYAYKAKEDEYRKSVQEFEENLQKMQNNYELLKQHATAKLNHANGELEKINKAHESEVLKLNAMIKRKDLHITSLEETLAQKTKANEELTAICDELINKVG